MSFIITRILLCCLWISTSFTVSGFSLLPSVALHNKAPAEKNQQPPKQSSRTRTSLDANVDEIIPVRPGSTVALITPMKDDGAIDVPTLTKLVQFHKEQQTDNFCILGTTAESSVLTMDERKTVIETVVAEVKGDIPIMVGTGTIDPVKVKEMTLQAIDLGCDANLVVSPYYVKPPQRCLVQHMVTMADLGLPVVVYNIPGRTGVDITDDNLAILAQHESIVAVKDATGDLSRVASLRKALDGNDFLLYSGDDGTSCDFVLEGGDGCISVTANLAPQRLHEIMKLANQGKADEARALNEPLQLLNDKLFVETNPIPAKFAAQQMGLIGSSYCRPPLDRLDPALEGEVMAALQAAGLV